MTEEILKELYLMDKEVGSSTTSLRISKSTYDRLYEVAHAARIPLGKMNAILVEYAIKEMGLLK